MITGKILRGFRHNYVAEALRMTFYSQTVRINFANSGDSLLSGKLLNTHKGRD